MKKIILFAFMLLFPVSIYAISARQCDFLISGIQPNGEAPTYARVHFYGANTLVAKTIWADANKNSTQSNPLTLDSDGEGTVYGDGIYDVVIETSTDGSTWTTYKTYAGVEIKTEGTPSPLTIALGGTNATTAGGARTNLGLSIGTDVQEWDADLDTIAASELARLAYQNEATSPEGSIRIDSAGNVHVSKNLTVGGSGHVSGNLTVSGSITYEGVLIITGNLTVPDLTVSTMSVTAVISSINITNGSLSVTGQPRVSLYNSGTIAGSRDTDVLLTFDSEFYDVGGMHDTMANTSTVNIIESGVYYIHGSVVVNEQSSATAVGDEYVKIAVNYSVVKTGSYTVPQDLKNNLRTYEISAVKTLSAGDVVQLIGHYQSSAGTNNGFAGGATGTNFTVVKLF